MAKHVDSAEPDAKARRWDFSNPGWVERLKKRQSLIPDLPLDKAEADRAVGIFNNLCLPDVPGQPRMRDAAGDWFRDIVSALFGSIDDTGRRMVSEIFALVPKKNSKTTGGAGIMVTALLMNERPRAEFLLVGPTQEVADTAYRQATGMIDADPYLRKRFHARDHEKTIVDRLNQSTLKVKTFDMKVMTGTKPVGVLIDEIHIMSSMAFASRVIGQIRGGMLPMPESFLIFITTQSDQPPTGCFKAELQLARGIRDGRVTGRAARMLPVLYEFPEDMQTSEDKPWLDPASWSMVTPNLDLSISLSDLEDDFAQAKEKGEEELRRWASQHLNVEIGLALHADRWRGADYWPAASRDLTLEDIFDRSDVIVAGIDGGGLDDLFALSVLGRCRVHKTWLHWAHAWCQTDVLDLRKDIAAPLRDFERDGDLTICENVTQDVMEVSELIERIQDAGLLPEKAGVGFDPQGVAAMVDELAVRDIGGDIVVGVAQGFRLSSAVWGVERKLKDGTFEHCSQPMMAWCIGNAKSSQRGNAVYIDKQTAGKAKIDPLVSLFNAAKLMERNPVASAGAIEIPANYEICA